MANRTVDKLLAYLKQFGTPEFVGADFSNTKNSKYARITITTKNGLAQKLVESINNELSPDAGSPAYLQFIDCQSTDNSHVKYIAYVIPYWHIPRVQHEMERATENFLQKLPRVIKSFAYLHKCK